MFERFTERARRVIILAREEAGRFRHDFVGTEHLLLGLVRDGEGIATAVLQRLSVPLETVKAELKRALAGFPKTLTFGEVPFTPQAKRVLELSTEEARQLGHNYIGTEHLLLGLMKEGQSISVRILESLGARLDEVRQSTLDQTTVFDIAWRRFLNAVANNLAPNVIDQWIRPCRLLRIEPHHVWLGAPNAFSRDWLIQHHLEALIQAAGCVVGSQPRVTIIVDDSLRRIGSRS